MGRVRHRLRGNGGHEMNTRMMFARAVAGVGEGKSRIQGKVLG